jgi:uncharacterized membrane protein YebE (DUF533 family)
MARADREGDSNSRVNLRRMAGTILLAIALGVPIAASSGCSGQPLSTREKGTLAGGALGAGTGAIIGSAVGAPGAGAAIGGALGAGTGLMIGNAMQNQENSQAATSAQVSQQQREIESQREEINRLQQEQ